VSETNYFYFHRKSFLLKEKQMGWVIVLSLISGILTSTICETSNASIIT
jgi:hypothetical protein